MCPAHLQGLPLWITFGKSRVRRAARGGWSCPWLSPRRCSARYGAVSGYW